MRLKLITFNIAHVGASKNPENPEKNIWGENDRHHNEMVWRWLRTNDTTYYGLVHKAATDNNISNDFIDLYDNRDFLAENLKYNIVILHMVYNPPDRRNVKNSIFQISDLHNPKNWIKRLESTDADYIFTFGDYDEVSAYYLGNINGYDNPIYKDLFQIYKKS